MFMVPGLFCAKDSILSWFRSHTCSQLVLCVVQVQPFVDIVFLALVVYRVVVGAEADY